MSSDGEWKEVDPDKEISEGDLIRTYHCVQAPNLLDSEIIARLSIDTAQLTGQLNQETPACMEAEVTDTELRDGAGTVVNGDECEYVYVTTMRVTKLEDGCRDLDYNSVGQLVVVALAAALVLAGIALVFYQAQKFISTDGGKEIGTNVSTAAILVAGGWAFKQFAESGVTGDDG